MEDISNMIRAAKSVGLSPIVRVPGTNPVNAMRCLDAGAEGVQIPQLTSLDQVEEVAKACRYHPLGKPLSAKATRLASSTEVKVLQAVIPMCLATGSASSP